MSIDHRICMILFCLLHVFILHAIFCFISLYVRFYVHIIVFKYLFFYIFGRFAYMYVLYTPHTYNVSRGQKMAFLSSRTTTTTDGYDLPYGC